MPRIPEPEVARLKQAVPLTRLAEARGVVLKGQGRNLIGLCPFHEDHEPSLVVDPEQNLWNCLGACRSGGSNVDWVMRDHGVGFREACEILHVMANGGAYPSRPAGYEQGAMKDTSARRLANPLGLEADGAELLAQVAGFYHQTLVDNPLATSRPAMDYLAQRKLADVAMLRHFRVGFSDRSLGLRVPDKARREGAMLRSKLARLGILRESGHELMAGAVVVPILDEAGSTVGMYGRGLNRQSRPGWMPHRYLPGAHAAAWNAAGAVNGDGAVIVCEAILDALSFWSAGIRQVTAAYGVNGFTPHHRRLVESASVRDVFIAYDNDEAGNGAAAALAQDMTSLGKRPWRIVFPPAVKDANGLAMASEDPAEALRAVLEAATAMAGVMVPVSRLPVEDPPPSPRPSAPAAKTEKTQPIPAIAAQPTVPPPAAVISSLAAPKPPVPVVTKDPKPAPSAAPAALSSSLLNADGEDLRAAFGPRRYRIRGLMKNADAATLKVGLRLSISGPAGDLFHQDTVDLCQARQRTAFIAAGAEAVKVETSAIAADLGRLLDACEVEWARRRQAAATAAPAAPARPTMDAAQEAAARAFLRTPDLLARIAADYEACGIVGGSEAKLVAYLCAVSRKLERPLAVLTMAASAAGKTSLQDATLAFVPEEDCFALSALTGQALHYVDEDLSHKVLAIAEEEGASRASYALKLLQSDGRLSLAVPVKDPETGRIATRIREVRGPVALFLTTTAPQIPEELANRCLVLTVDESADQTARVHAAQRAQATLDGLVRQTRTAAIRQVHQNAQRLLTPMAVVNPYAPLLTFRADRPRTRRDHLKYLGLIQAIALLHQHQRPRQVARVASRDVPYLEATLDDIEAANRLAAVVLGRSLDELAPQTRSLLEQVEAMVTARAQVEGRAASGLAFTRRSLREYTNWSYNQIRDHLCRLVELEYVIPSRPTGQGLVAEYTLAYDGQGKTGAPFVMGLADVATIRAQAQAGVRPAGSSIVVPASGGSVMALCPPETPALSPLCPGVVPLGGQSGFDGFPREMIEESPSLADLADEEAGGHIGADASSHPRHNGHATRHAATLPALVLANGEEAGDDL